MGSGFYLRDEFGNFLLAKIGYWNSQVLVQEGDAFALLQAMKIFETHGKQLVGHLHGPKSLLTESRILIQQIRNVLHQHSGFQVRFVCHNANSVAHLLARFAVQNHENNVFHSIPLCIDHIIAMEK